MVYRLPDRTEFVTVSPSEHPFRAVFTGLAAVYLSYYALKFLRSVKSGTTIILRLRSPILSFRVLPGRVSLTASQKKAGFTKSYNGPLGTAFLGLLFFSAAQIMLVLVFKRADYYWFN